MSEGDFLSRWSRRKGESRRGHAEPEVRSPAGPIVVPAEAGTQSSLIPAEAGTQAPAAPAEAGTQSPSTPLPPLESLTSESDFAPFMRPDVDAGVRRAALKTLFDNPRFNVQDGLDVYIGDYSQPDPLPEGWLEKMNQVRYLGHYQAPVEAATEEEASAVAAIEGSTPPAVPAPGADPAREALPAAEPHPAAQESAQTGPEPESGA